MSNNDRQTIANFKLWEVEMKPRAIRARITHYARFAYFYCRCMIKELPVALREPEDDNEL